jgi:lipopolysaccharide transport system permease protein
MLLWGQLPAWPSTLGYLACSMTVAWFGWAMFQLTRRGFADVL